MIGKWKLIRSFKKHRIFPKIYFLWKSGHYLHNWMFLMLHSILGHNISGSYDAENDWLFNHEAWHKNRQRRMKTDSKRSPEVRKWLTNSRFSYLLVCCPSDTIAESLPQQRSQFQLVANALNHSWSVKYILGIHCIYN